MVPGLDGTALLFYRQIPLLAPDFRVVSFRLPDDPTTTMEDLIADLAHVIDEVGGSETVLMCGESFGGALSLSFALAHPARVRGLIIVNSFPRVRQRLQLKLGPALMKAIPWSLMPLVRRFTESRMHTSHTTPEDLREFHERSRSIGKEGYIRRLEILQSYDIRDRLQEIEAPTLFLAADEDHLVASVKEARFMASCMPDATVKVLEGFGHICLINHELDLAATIAPWVHEKRLLA